MMDLIKVIIATAFIVTASMTGISNMLVITSLTDILTAIETVTTTTAAIITLFSTPPL